jgi:hypothetical protein
VIHRIVSRVVEKVLGVATPNHSLHPIASIVPIAFASL